MRGMDIEEWEWDDANREELYVHGLNRRIVEQVAEERPRFRANKKGRAATHQMIGPDFSGTIWVICIVQCKGVSDTWRAVTGWRAEKPEEDWYRRHL